MSQIQIRDQQGRGLPGINIRVAEGQKSSDAAIFDFESDSSGNKGWPIPFWPKADYTLHINQPEVGVPQNPRYESKSVLVPAAQFPNDVRIELQSTETVPTPLPIPVPPVGNREALKVWPRYGLNIASLIVNRQYRIAASIQRFADAGANFTDVNWLSAVWPSLVEHGVFPWKRTTPPFDLFDWNSEFFERANEVRERCNAAGIVVQGTLWELYSWSNRKRGSGTPDANQGPWRNNINGIRLGGAYNGDRHEDDETLTTLIPTDFCREFLPRILAVWDAEVNPVRLGNEMPEKGLHERLRDLVRATEPTALITVNRNEDTPGQYANMKIGVNYDRIEFHGAQLKTVADLMRVYPVTVSSVPTYQALLDKSSTDKKRITFSSDGARSGPGKDGPTDPYEWDKLKAFFRTVGPKGEGCSILHQSRAKMTPAPNEHMIEVEFFRSVIT